MKTCSDRTFTPLSFPRISLTLYKLKIQCKCTKLPVVLRSPSTLTDTSSVVLLCVRTRANRYNPLCIISIHLHSEFPSSDFRLNRRISLRHREIWCSFPSRAKCQYPCFTFGKNHRVQISYICIFSDKKNSLFTKMIPPTTAREREIKNL